MDDVYTVYLVERNIKLKLNIDYYMVEKFCSNIKIFSLVTFRMRRMSVVFEEHWSH